MRQDFLSLDGLFVHGADNLNGITFKVESGLILVLME
jgi:hypothetical protein